jgi:hypothetical protein
MRSMVLILTLLAASCAAPTYAYAYDCNIYFDKAVDGSPMWTLTSGYLQKIQRGYWTCQGFLNDENHVQCRQGTSGNYRFIDFYLYVTQTTVTLWACPDQYCGDYVQYANTFLLRWTWNDGTPGYLTFRNGRLATCD